MKGGNSLANKILKLISNEYKQKFESEVCENKLKPFKNVLQNNPDGFKIQRTSVHASSGQKNIL